MDVFEKTLPLINHKVCYNGELLIPDDCKKIETSYPSIQSLMIGRGVVKNPALISQIKGGKAADKATLQAFHDTLFHGYCVTFQSEQCAMLRMKEFWNNMILLFADNQKYMKLIHKSKDPMKYRQIIADLFQNGELISSSL